MELNASKWRIPSPKHRQSRKAPRGFSAFIESLDVGTFASVEETAGKCIMFSKMGEGAKNKFLEVKELFNRMSHEISAVVESYHIWRTLTFSRSTLEVGEAEAEKNAALLSLYKDFFIPTEQSHLQTFVIGLMKFFDRDSRALSIAGLIRELDENSAIFTADVVRSTFKEPRGYDPIKDDYAPITQAIKDEIEALRKPHETLIANLKDIRDKQFAHTDMETISGTFVPLEVEALIEAVQEMFNRLSGNFDSSTTMWSYLSGDSIRNTKFLFESLERGEAQRKKEYEAAWKL